MQSAHSRRTSPESRPRCGALASLQPMWTWLNENAGAIEALASWALLLVAVLAAIVAWAQVNEARRLRREQAQPYVVAGMRSSAASPLIIEIFFRNYGTTAAFDVQVQADPPLTTQGDGDRIDPLMLFDVLPTMVPGEEWATWWDSATTRWESGQAMSSTVTVSFSDSSGGKHSGKYVLDWNAHQHRQFIVRKDVDDLAKAAAKLSDNIGRVVSDGALIVQDKAARREELAAQRATREARRLAARESDSTSPEDQPPSS